MLWCEYVDSWVGTGSTSLRWPSLRPLGRRSWRLLRSARLAVVLFIALAAAATIGTLLPPAEADARGGLLVRALGLRDLFSSIWFNGLLALLGLNTLCCSLSRLRLTWRRAISTSTHGGVVLILIGAGVGGVFGADGHVRVERGQPVTEFTDQSGARMPLGFALFLEEANTETDGEPRPFILFDCDQDPEPRRIPLARGRDLYRVADTPYSLRVVRRIADFATDSELPGSVRAIEGLTGPALLLEVLREGRPPDRRILFAQHPRLDVRQHAGSDVRAAYLLEPVVRNYASRVRIERKHGARRTATIRVNDPLTVGATRLFQMDMDHRLAAWSVFRVNRDPGLPLVYTGFLLLAVGIGGTFTPLGRRHGAGRGSWKAT